MKDNKVLFANDSDPCCCGTPTPTPCAYCPPDATGPVSVTFANVTMDSGCRYCSRQIGQTNDNTVELTGGALDGEYLVVPLPGGDGEFNDGCCWVGSTTITVVLRQNDFDCTRTISETVMAVTIIVGRNSNSWGVRVFSTGGTFLQVSYFNNDLFTDDCADLADLPNDYTDPSCGNGSLADHAGAILAFLGTATINF